ncbi:MAG TPA: DUF2723 domain-containing protein, partial [Thermoanaerobaculia bacterium]|nr:DUF2723 domain-containing protein [Thermoanaerobaculia bacterium]
MVEKPLATAVSDADRMIAAALVLARLLERLEVQPPLATAAALAFGCAPAVWSQSIVAEVYTGHLLLMVSVLLFALRWLDAGEERDFRRASALYAFSFSHHLTAVTLLPALLFLGWQREGVRLFRPARLAWLAGCGFLALLPYGYIFWRSLDPETVYLEAQATDAASFLRLLAPDNARGNLFGFSLGTLLTERLPSFLRLLWGQFGPLLAVAVFGLAILRPRKITLTLALAALGSLVFALNYDIPDIETYYLVVYLVVAVFLGVGLDRLGRMLPEGLRPLLATLALAAPVAGAALHYAAVDQSHNTELARRLEAVLDTAAIEAFSRWYAGE